MEEYKSKIIDLITKKMDEMVDDTSLFKLHKVMELYCTTEQIIEAYKHAINTAMFENENQEFSSTKDEIFVDMLETLIIED